MTIEIELGPLIVDWIEEHPVFKDHFLVVEHEAPEFIIIKSTHYITYRCPNRVDMWASLYITRQTILGYSPMEDLNPGDPRFFDKLEALLIKLHDSHKYCKEYLGETGKSSKRRRISN